MLIEIMLKMTGVSLICLGLIHVFLPKQFHWKEEMARVSLLNRQIFYVHCFFLVIVLLMMGLLSLVYAEELLMPTAINRAVLGGLTVFWGVRLVFQWVVYSPELWRGKKFETWMHWLFTGVWAFYTITYGLAWRLAMG